MIDSNLITVVYVSSATGMLADKDIFDILRVSRSNNSEEDITGMLLFKDGNFMQVLEGPRERVMRLLEKIGRDHRHRGIIQLFTKDIQQRSFAEWSMAFHNLNTTVISEQGYSPFLATSLLDQQFRDRPETCYKLLVSFKNNMR